MEIHVKYMYKLGNSMCGLHPYVLVGSSLIPYGNAHMHALLSYFIENVIIGEHLLERANEGYIID